MLVLKGIKAPMLFLLVSCAVATYALSHNPRHEKFLRQHSDFPQTAVAGQDYCGTMMLRRGLTRPCKATNSFVHVPRTQLKDICGWAGTHYRRALRLSRAELPVTTCSLQGSSRGRCRYWTHRGKRHILIGCDPSGWPVHFEESNFIPS
uniref:Ribonuclease A-domain domain-containing protein n=1 Tax=Salvator merianae TaxID=96440 RepID=A0A8D0BHN4_SALMN